MSPPRLNYKKGNFIAALALAQAYDFAGRYDEAIEIYKQALENNPTANENELLIIHGNLANFIKTRKISASPYVNIRSN